MQSHNGIMRSEIEVNEEEKEKKKPIERNDRWR